MALIIEQLRPYLLIIGLFLGLIPILRYSFKNKKKKVARNILFVGLIYVSINLLIIYFILNIETVDVLKTWAMLVSLSALLSGATYTIIKELMNVEVEMLNRILTTLPIGMSLFIVLGNLLYENEIIKFLITPLSLIVGTSFCFYGIRIAKQIHGKSDQFFWKKLHVVWLVIIISLIVDSIWIYSGQSIMVLQNMLIAMLFVVNIIFVIPNLNRGDSK